jgi:hypothetical protein
MNNKYDIIINVCMMLKSNKIKLNQIKLNQILCKFYIFFSEKFFFFEF